MDWPLHRGDELVPGRRIKAKLGGGKRYQVFLTWNERLLCPTVVKVLRPDVVDHPRARRAIGAEAAVLRRIEHPSFIRLFGSDVEGPRPFVELEFLDGPRLSSLVQRHGVLLAEQLYPLARQLAAALHYLHGEGYVHLDVKPANVIMGPVPRLIDLSIARRLEQIASIESPLGTDAYMAPEQADRQNLASIGPASDVWGLGVTLYEAATKRLPFPRGRRDGGDSDRWPQLVLEPEPAPGKVRRKLATVIMRCLERDPGARPSPLELFEAFDDLATDHGLPRLRLRATV